MPKRKQPVAPAVQSSPKIRRISSGEDDSDLEGSVEDLEAGNADHEQADQDDEGDDEWTGTGIDQPPSITSYNQTKSKTMPSLTEIRTIQTAASLYSSTLFKLQLDSLLPSLRFSAHMQKSTAKFLHWLHAHLTAMQSVPAASPVKATEQLKIKGKEGVKVPWVVPEPGKDVNWTVAFEPPEREEIVVMGSWANSVGVKRRDGTWAVDLGVGIPESLLQPKDIHLPRFHSKRAFYLANIASSLQSVLPQDDFRIEWEESNDDLRLTKLVVSSTTKISSTDDEDDEMDDAKVPPLPHTIKINIIPLIPSNASIPLQKLSPTHSNIRFSSTSQPGEEQNTHASSPLYNATLLQQTTKHVKAHIVTTHNLKSSCPAFADALALLRVWAEQRGFSSASTSTSTSSKSANATETIIASFPSPGLVFSCVLTYILLGSAPNTLGPAHAQGRKEAKRRPLGRGVSSYQLFRAALDFFAGWECEREPVFVRSEGGEYGYEQEDYVGEEVKGPVLVLPEGVNVVSGVAVGALGLLKHEARCTLSVLDAPAPSLSSHHDATGKENHEEEAFKDTFLEDKRKGIRARFDVVVPVDLSKLKPTDPPTPFALAEFGSARRHILHVLEAKLKQGLGDRVRVLCILEPATRRGVRDIGVGSTNAKTKKTSAGGDDVVYACLILDPERAFRLVDHAYPPSPSSSSNDKAAPAFPSADDPTIIAFNSFWGPEKSSLRRFADGRIAQSVVWTDEVKDADGKMRVPEVVVRFVLGRHFSYSNGGEGSGDLDRMTKLPKDVAEGVEGKAGFRPARVAFDGLVKALKRLSDDDNGVLPLNLLAVHPISPNLRYTSSYVPFAGAEMEGEPMRVILEFEKSTRWPDDRGAIGRMKCAFYEGAARRLVEREGWRAEVVLSRRALRDAVCGDASVGPDQDEGDEDGEEEEEESKLVVRTREGWTFECFIVVERERYILEQTLKDAARKKLPGLPEPPSKGTVESAKRGLGRYARTYEAGPAHHRAVSAVVAGTPGGGGGGAYAGTVRLVKRWLGAHWVLGHAGDVGEEAVELIVARVFFGGRGVDEDGLAGGVGRVPSTKERGFAFVLRMLSAWRWEEGGLVCDVVQSQSKENGDVDGERAKGETTTMVGPGTGVWRLYTDADRSGTMWTRAGPDVLIANRVRALAKAAWEVVCAATGEVDWKTLFVHPTEDYDFLVYLRKDAVLNAALDVREVETASKAWKRARNGEERIGFDPAAMFFDDLERTYRHTLRLFRDPYGGRVIGGLWDPSLKEERPFRVLGRFNAVPSKDDERKKGKRKDMVLLNRDAVLEEIGRMGRGIVERIEVQV